MTKTMLDVAARDLRVGDELFEKAGYTVAKVTRHRNGTLTVWTTGGIRFQYVVGERVRVRR